MKIKLRLLLPATLLSICVSATFVSAQTVSDPLASLPTSDVVGFIDLRRILTEIVPRVLAKDPATLLKMTNTLNELNTKTGLNILSIDRIAVGLQFVGATTHNIKKEDLGIAIIAHGDFDADALVAFLKSETKGKGSEESYGGKTIHVEPRPTPPAKKSDREIAALSILDAHTLVLGDLPQVRAAIDASSGKGRVDSALVRLATRDSNALIGVAGNVPPELIKDLQSSASNDPTEQAIGKLIANIKQVFVSFGATPADFDVITGARLGTAEQAQSLSDMLLGLRQQIVNEVTDQQYHDLLNSIQISAQNEEVQIKAAIKTEVVQDIAASMVKDEKSKVTTLHQDIVLKKVPATTKHRRRRRRRKH